MSTAGLVALAKTGKNKELTDAFGEELDETQEEEQVEEDDEE